LNILVTGASGGFGELITKTLAKDGHHVFATMRGVGGKNVNAAGQLKSWAQGEKLAVEVIELDVTSQDSVDTARGSQRRTHYPGRAKKSDESVS
jgi:NAD(P)-dependent dehydrogenase (short-subunit alcohol dehydrogenase family)